MNLRKAGLLFIIASLGVLSFLGCGSRDSSISGPVVHDTVFIKSANLQFKTTLGPTGSIGALPKIGSLQKTSVISLSKLIIQITSSAADTVRDTILAGGGLSATSSTAQTINKNYDLKSLRTWKLVAKTLDNNDSLIHKDSATTSQLNPADTAVITFSMNAKYSMYEAKFLTIPGLISSSAAGTGTDSLHLKRLVFKLDGSTVIDSTNPSGYFTPGSTITLPYDYVTASVAGINHTVQLLAYTGPGGLHFWDSSLPLYNGSIVINTTSGVDLAQPVTLNWVGPTTGTGKLSITIGKVGKVTVNGTLPGTVIP